MKSHWVYHPDHPAKIVDDIEYERLLDADWHDNPSKFPVIEKSGLVSKPGRKPKAEKVTAEEAQKETDNDENKVISLDEKIETNVIPQIAVGKPKRQFIL